MNFNVPVRYVLHFAELLSSAKLKKGQYSLNMICSTGNALTSVVDPDLESGIRCFLRNSISFLGKKYLNSLMQIRIRDLGNPGSGMEKVGSGMSRRNILDPQH